METEAFVEGAQRDEEDDEEDNENWTDLERFQNFTQSQHPLRRLVSARGLEQTVNKLTVSDAVEHCLPLLNQVAEDEESSVRDALSAQLAPALRDLLGRARGDEPASLVSCVWPLSLTLLRDKDQQVRAVAEDAVVEYASLLPPNILNGRILEDVIAMSKQDAEDERMTCVKLLGELSFALKQDVLVHQVAPVVVNLAGDSMFRVRKATALYIGKVCRWSPKGFAVSDLLPVYLALAEDEIWGVRKACAESIADVASSLSPQVRTEKLIPLFEQLATDASRWVRNSAFQHLGTLIGNLTSAEVTPKLLELFR